MPWDGDESGSGAAIKHPVNGFGRPFSQELVGARKKPRAQEASIGRERRRMRTLNNYVPGVINELGFDLGGIAEQDEGQDAIPAAGQGPDDGVSDFFPAAVAVRAGLMGADGQYRVEQEDALPGPGL